MSHVANQIVSVSAWLSNFFLPLIPPPSDAEPPANDDLSSDTDKDIDDCSRPDSSTLEIVGEASDCSNSSLLEIVG